MIASPRRSLYLVGCLLLAAGAVRAQPVEAVSSDSTQTVRSTPMPSGAERWRDLGGDLVSPRFFVRALVTSTVAHLSEEPDSWDQDTAGFAARLASNAGGALVYTGTEHGLAALLGVDLRYRPRGEGRCGARLGHAFLGSVTARTDDRWMPNLPLAGSAVVSAVTRSHWKTGSVDVGGFAQILTAALPVETMGNTLRCPKLLEAAVTTIDKHAQYTLPI
ncbi:MAG: hypothetical protein AAGN64_07830 [Bacteroidota bacterium]